MGDFNAQIWKRTNPMETARGTFGLGLKEEGGDTFVEWATSRKYKITNTMLQKKAGTRWTWKSPSGVTKTDIDYILTIRTAVGTDVTIINQVDTGSHRQVMSNIKRRGVEVERNT